MLALREPGTHRRIAEGRSCAELALATGASYGHLKTQLERLAQRDVRLLEIVSFADEEDVRYRLPHERLIPALHRMAGQVLAEIDQIKLRFENAFTAWRNSGRGARYLLKGAELRSIDRYESEIPWGEDAQEKRNFLRHSRRRRAVVRLGVLAIVIFAIAGAWLR